MVKFFLMKDGNFRQVFKAPPIDWCAVVRGNNTNPVTKSFVATIKKYAPDFIHPCPYNGRHELRNVRGMKEILTILPKGVIKFVAKMIDGDKIRSMTVTLMMEIL